MWLHIPGLTPSASAPASADSTEALLVRARRFASSCTSSGKSRQPPFWRRECETAYWTKLLSGATLDRSAAQNAALTFAERLGGGKGSMPSSAASPASRTALRAKSKGRKTTETSGPSLSLPLSDTSPGCSSLRTSPTCSGMCPKSLSLICDGLGTSCLDRSCLKPQGSDLLRNASGCSCWPTADASAHKRGCLGYTEKQINRPQGMPSILDYDAIAFLWPTITIHGNTNQLGMSKNSGEGLGTAAKKFDWPGARSEDAEACGNHPGAMDSLTGTTAQWKTPRASMAENGNDSGSQQRAKQGANLGLKDQASQWSAPNAEVSNDGEEPETWEARIAKIKEKGINGNGAGTPLAIMAQQWAARSDRSRQAQDLDLTGLLRMFLECSKPTLAAAAIDFLRSLRNGRPGNASSTSDPILPRPSAKTSKRRLNQKFVGALMGFLPNWTEI